MNRFRESSKADLSGSRTTDWKEGTARIRQGRSVGRRQVRTRDRQVLGMGILPSLKWQTPSQ